MRALVVLGALLSHWRRHKVQLAMLLLGLALATGLWTGVQAINAEARASYTRAAETLAGDRLSRIVPKEGGWIAQADYIALRRAGWQVSPLVEGEVRIGPERVRLLGVDPLTLPAEARMLNSVATGLAAFTLARTTLYTAPQTAERLGHGLVAAEGLPAGIILTDIGEAQRLLGLNGRLSRLILAAEQPIGIPELSAVVAGLVVQAPEATSDMARLTDSFHLNLTAFGLLAFLVGLFIVQSAIGLAFEQRRGMVRTVRAMGMPLAGLMAIMIGELVGLALLAGLIGVVLGYGVAWALLPGVSATLRGLYGAEVGGGLDLPVVWWLWGLLIAVAGTLAAAALQLIQVWRLPMLHTAKVGGRAAGVARLMWLQGAVSVLCAGLSVGLLLFGDGLVAGFLVLAGLILSAAAGLPMLMSGLLALARRRARGALAEWFWADTQDQLPGLSLALVALMLALATNLGVGTMVSSFRQTFVGWLDQRLASELYVTTRSDAEAAAVAQWLKTRADAVLPILSVEAPLYGAPGEVFGVIDHPTYRDNWPLLAQSPGLWLAVAAGQGALINEQLHYRQHLALGDRVTLPGGWSVPVVGIYSDYGNPLAQVMVGAPALVAHFPEVTGLRMGVRVASARAPALAEALREAFDLPVRNVVDQSSIKAMSLRVFERTFGVTSALNALTLLVAGVAMFASLLTLAAGRLPQLAPVWAAGMTRRGLAMAEFARSLLLAVLAMLVAVPVGLGLAWVLLNVVNVEAFGWRLPMYLFPLDWLKLALLGLVAAALAAAIPVLRLARVAPSALLKVFANAT